MKTLTNRTNKYTRVNANDNVITSNTKRAYANTKGNFIKDKARLQKISISGHWNRGTGKSRLRNLDFKINFKIACKNTLLEACY